jgi:hypothetical protein
MEYTTLMQCKEVCEVCRSSPLGPDVNEAPTERLDCLARPPERAGQTHQARQKDHAACLVHRRQRYRDEVEQCGDAEGDLSDGSSGGEVGPIARGSREDVPEGAGSSEERQRHEDGEGGGGLGR